MMSILDEIRDKPLVAIKPHFNCYMTSYLEDKQDELVILQKYRNLKAQPEFTKKLIWVNREIRNNS